MSQQQRESVETERYRREDEILDWHVWETLSDFANFLGIREPVTTDRGYGDWSGANWFSWEITEHTEEGEEIFSVRVLAFRHKNGVPDKRLNLHFDRERGKIPITELIIQEVSLAKVLHDRTGWPVVYVSEHRIPRRQVQKITRLCLAQHWRNDRGHSNIYFGYPKFYPWWMFWKYPRNKAP